MNIQATRRRFGSADYLKISIFGAGLSLFWASLHALILSQRVEALAPEASKNAYLGLITFAGLIVAMLVQPFAGGLSDRSTRRWGQRRPFILLGTVLGLVVLPEIGVSASAGGGALSRLVGPGIDYLNGRSAGLGYTAMLWLVGFYFVAGTGLMMMLRSRTQSAETNVEASAAP